MSSDFDQMVNELDRSIMKEMRKVYSEVVIDHFLHPRNVGKIEGAEGHGKLTGSCEDTIEIYLRISDDRIADAKFMTDGCGTTIASGSMATELAKGKDVHEALKINTKYVLDHLGGLPESDRHCAELAAGTLLKAILDYLASKREPWKRAYRNI
ncbi:iron-sulfur cluster assembly scaffold protein [candidate division KSB1 bacterium]|nr:iron-sulfur cluster assembly scaffold protein [candidate division KSB1 bacterium]